MKKNIFIYLKNIFNNLFPTSEENWKIIVLCLLGATIFWFFNALNKEYSARIKYPVEFAYDPDETVLVEPLPEDVRIEVRGGGWNLLRKTFWFNVEPVIIPLEEPTEVKYLTSRSLRPIFTDQIAEIRIEDVLVDTLRLNIQKRITKALPVVVDSASIKLAPDHKIVSPIRISNDSIVVVGPTSQVEALGNSLVLSLNNEVISSNYFEDINVSAYLPSKVVSNPPQVNVAFDVQQFLNVNKQVEVEPVNFPESVFLKDSLITASVYLSRNDIEKLNSSNIKVVADYRRLNRKDSTINLRLMEYPDFISNISLNTETVQVEYEK